MFGLAPQALEPLRISTFLLGGVGLIGGTLAGRAGITGLVQNQARSWRRRRVGPRADARLDVEADRCAEPHDVELRSAAATVGEGR
jgi:hypothetical protein